MMAGGDAAEQIVRLSLEGVEVAAKITGEGAKNLAIFLAAVLREEHKTKGKTRISNMIKSGKELKVFSIQNKDLPKFYQEAKRYGVLYCVLKDKNNDSDFAPADVIARAEDASKIQRIVERFELASVDRNAVVNEVTKDMEARKAKEKGVQTKDAADLLLDEILAKPIGKEEQSANPHLAKTEKSPLSEQSLMKGNRSGEGVCSKIKPSVREKLKRFEKEIRIKQKKERSASAKNIKAENTVVGSKRKISQKGKER